MSEKKNPDPFPQLPRRGLFVDQTSKPPPKVPRPPLPPHIIDTGLVICPDGNVAKVSTEAKRNRGRPTIGKPWEAEGISRSAWFAKRKKDLNQA